LGVAVVLISMTSPKPTASDQQGANVMIKITHRTKATSSMAVAALLVLTSCGSDAASSDTSPAAPAAAPNASAEPAATAPVSEASATDDSGGYGYPAEAPDESDAPAASDAAVVIAEIELGNIMTDADGLTVYGFTKDVDGSSTCNDACAGAWPPVIVDAAFDVSSLPAEGSFSVVERDDGTTQLKAGKWPLYTFSGDAGPGDTNGQGSGDVWFVVAEDAALIK
jgi:predicted lipoprotein with Yx(FWY)xxD motif